MDVVVVAVVVVVVDLLVVVVVKVVADVVVAVVAVVVGVNSPEKSKIPPSRKMMPDPYCNANRGHTCT